MEKQEQNLCCNLNEYINFNRRLKESHQVGFQDNSNKIYFKNNLNFIKKFYILYPTFFFLNSLSTEAWFEGEMCNGLKRTPFENLIIIFQFEHKA